jgi:hypothetical protein
MSAQYFCVPARPHGSTGTSRAPLRLTRGGHSASRGSLLLTTRTGCAAIEFHH